MTTLALPETELRTFLPFSRILLTESMISHRVDFALRHYQDSVGRKERGYDTKEKDRETIAKGLKLLNRFTEAQLMATEGKMIGFKEEQIPLREATYHAIRIASGEKSPDTLEYAAIMKEILFQVSEDRINPYGGEVERAKHFFERASKVYQIWDLDRL